MIKTMSSIELMNVLDKTEDQVSDLYNRVNTIRSELDKKVKIFSNAMEFAAEDMLRFEEYLIQNEAKSNTTFILTDQEKVAGSYDKYGLTVYPYSNPNSTNVFNFITATGPVYKNNASVYINDEASPLLADMLMHDAIKDKSTSFDEMLEDEFTIKITVNTNDLFSSTACNTIELLPLISGSFDITGIRIYTMQDYRSQSPVPSISFNSVLATVGASRILLPSTIELYSCEMDIKAKFKNSAGKYPFGFKHIYFLKSSYDTESYMVFKASRNQYIDWISDDIVIHDQDGTHITTCTDEKIELYMSYVDGKLQDRITPSKGLVQETIPRNIYDFYIKIPITKGIISVKFKTIAER